MYSPLLSNEKEEMREINSRMSVCYQLLPTFRGQDPSYWIVSTTGDSCHPYSLFLDKKSRTRSKSRIKRLEQ